MTNLIYEVRRRRGWTQAQLQHQLRLVAPRFGVVLPDGRETMRIMISGWENNRHQPRADHALLLQTVFDLPGEALGLVQTDDDLTADDTAVRSLLQRIPATPTPEVLDYYSGQLDHHARMDNLTGPVFVLDAVLGQAQAVASLPGPAAQRTASRFAEFAGWLLQDSGDTAKALVQTDRAVDLADAAGDDVLSAYNLMRKSNVLSSLGEHERAAQVARKSVALADALAPDQLAVCLRQQALAAARLRDERTARDAFERALVPTGPALSGDEMSTYCTTSYVQMEAGLCWLALGRPGDAVEACTAALRMFPSELVRDEALCRARLSVAQLQLHEVEAASDTARQSLERVRSAPSARTLHMLQLLAKKLEPYRGDRAVRDLTREIAEVA